MRNQASVLIDRIQQRLGDGGSVIERDEILDWLNDGYGRLVREALTPCLLEAHDIPPKVQYAVTHEWEREYVSGTTRKFTFSHESGRYDCTYLHETSTHAGTTAQPSSGNVTQFHMLDVVGDTTDTPYRFAMPRRYTTLHVWYDNEMVTPVSSSQLEASGKYWEIEGVPSLYTTDETYNEFDLYRVQTSNHGAYDTDQPIGIPRAISGDRTYEISPKGEPAIGIIREISSPDRQYHNSSPWDRHGTIRAWASSDDNLLVYSAVEPERRLSESDTLRLIPAQLEKYVVFYALSMIHNRQGELYEPNMAEHYRGRFRRGAILLSRIRNLGYRDTDYGRDREMRDRTPVALPQFPGNYPRLRLH